MTSGGAVVVAQLVERSLPIQEVRGSIPVIGKIYIEHLFTCLLSTVLKRRKKEAGNGPLFNKKNNNYKLVKGYKINSVILLLTK